MIKLLNLKRKQENGNGKTGDDSNKIPPVSGIRVPAYPFTMPS